MKILVIEDEEELRKVIVTALQQELYIVESAHDYHSGIEKLGIYNYDCIVLDIQIPGGSGLQILELLKKTGKTENVIITSAQDSLEDKIKGLALGADDYLTKPFHIAELNARIKAILRRTQTNGRQWIEIANVKLDVEERFLMINDNVISLNRKEFDMLYYFMLNKNRLITKTALAEHIWDDDIDQADNYDFIYSQIKNLRKKFHTHHAKVDFVAVYGVGYKLVENKIN